MNHHFFLTVAFLSAVFISIAIADPSPGQIDAVFSSMSENTPGCALRLIRDNHFIYSKGYGSQSLSPLKVPFEVSAPTFIGSMSKQFTAMSVAILVRRNLVDLEEPIQTYLPDFPRYEQGEVRVKHLVHMTSGIRDCLELLAYTDATFKTPTSLEETYRLLREQKRLNFAPGDSAMYSNSNYILMRMIVQSITKMEFADFVQQEIFDVLGMNSTRWNMNQDAIIPHSVDSYNYNPSDKSFVKDIAFTDIVGAGGLQTNLDDFAKWDANFYNNSLNDNDPGLINLTLTPGYLNSGQKVSYAFGLALTKLRDGKKVITHSGLWMGYRTTFVRVPEDRFTLSLFCNALVIDPIAIQNKLLVLYGYQSRKPSDKREAVSLIDLSNDDSVILNRNLREELLTKDQHVIHTSFPTNRDKHDFVGIYFSKETEAVVHIKLTNDQVTLVVRGAGEFILDIEEDLSFKVQAFPQSKGKFKEDESGDIVGFEFGIERAFGIEWVKTDQEPVCYR